MKLNRYIGTLIVGTIVLSGCSLINGSTKIPASTGQNLPVSKIKADTTYSAVTNPSSIIAGEWTIYKVNDRLITGEENRPYIIFDESCNRFYATNGCNTLNGDYLLGSANRISLSNVISTMRSCPDATFEYEINNAINDARSISASRQGNEFYLDIKDESGRVIMILRKHNMDYLNGSWQIVNINENSCDNEALQMVIDIPELKIHGNTGCNIFNGSLLIDPDKSNSIMFQQIISTRMSCPDIQQETALLIALEEVDHCLPIDNTDKVVLYNRKGKQVLVLQRISNSLHY